MIARLGLTRILWRQAMPATFVGGLGLGLYALAWPDVMTTRDPWPGLIVLAHCLLLAGLLGRFETPAFAFTYSRGYSRNALWGHMMLASGLSVLAAMLPACLIVWTGLRSHFHDLLHSPYFPVMAPRETWVPLIWLGLYLLLVPACHYAWIRRAQPTRGSHGGSLVVIGLLAAMVVGFDVIRHLDAWFAWLAGVLYAAALVCLVLGGRALHRSLEVRS